MLIDRAYNQVQALIEQADQGMSVVLRYNPHSLNVYDVTGAKIDWYEQQLKGTLESEQCVPVQVRAENDYVEGTVHGLPS
nr:IS4/IS5 family transposase [Gammaproteobacteria bacterium]